MGKIVRHKWRLDALLGLGGMASVYAATHRNGHRVAVKMLHPWLQELGEARERFLREAYVANSVQHPGVVKVIDDDEAEDGSPYLVMELLQGESLEDRIERLGAIAPSEALLITRDLLSILEAAHAAKVIHRDIKPDNIFLERSDSDSTLARAPVRLLDFGIARLRELNSTQQMTQQGFLLGTPGYMAPEQAIGRWDKVDARTDLWAVGATLYAMILGAPPRPGEDVQTLLAAASQPLPDPEKTIPGLPLPVANLIRKGTAVDMNDRYPDAATMRRAVESCRSKLESTETSVAVKKLVASIEPLPIAGDEEDLKSQEFDRSDLALTPDYADDFDDIRTRYQPLPPEVAQSIRRERTSLAPRGGTPAAGLKRPDTSKGGIDPLAKTTPGGALVPADLEKLIAEAKAKREAREASGRQANQPKQADQPNRPTQPNPPASSTPGTALWLAVGVVGALGIGVALALAFSMVQ